MTIDNFIIQSNLSRGEECFTRNHPQATVKQPASIVCDGTQEATYDRAALLRSGGHKRSVGKVISQYLTFVKRYGLSSYFVKQPGDKGCPSLDRIVFFRKLMGAGKQPFGPIDAVWRCCCGILFDAAERDRFAGRLQWQCASRCALLFARDCSNVSRAEHATSHQGTNDASHTGRTRVCRHH